MAGRLRRFLSICLLLAVLLVTSYVLVLAFPQILLNNSVQNGTVTIHFDSGEHGEMTKLAEAVERRLELSRFYDSTRTNDVYFFSDQGLYEFYSGLLQLPPTAQGFNLSVFGNSYVSKTRIAALGARTGQSPKYSVWEGSPAHTIAHEIGHDYLVGLIGSGRWRKLPHWKREGLPEYIANSGLVKSDKSLTLRRRIEILEASRSWSTTQGPHYRGWDRIHYEAWLLVEYLFEVRKLSLQQIIDESLTKDAAMAAMQSWMAGP